MPVVLRRNQYSFRFFAIDVSEPPHVHIGHAGRSAKYWIDPIVRMADNKGFRSHELTEIAKIIESEREYLMEAWNEFFRR